jgi:hypothetical protein
METKFQTSFIPKQPLTEDSPHRTSAASLFFLFAFIVFMASIAAAGAVFIYSNIISNNIKQGQIDLTKNKNAFDGNTIKSLTRLNDRINAVDTLLKKHKSVSSVFQVLENVTLKTVQFSSFGYTASDDKIKLTLTGQAFNYEAVILQTKAFTNEELKGVFRSPIFSGVALDSQGNVSFNFESGIDPFLVDYYKLKKEELTGSPSTRPKVTNSDVSGFTQTTNNVVDEPIVTTPADGANN